MTSSCTTRRDTIQAAARQPADCGPFCDGERWMGTGPRITAVFLTGREFGMD